MNKQFQEHKNVDREVTGTAEKKCLNQESGNNKIGKHPLGELFVFLILGDPGAVSRVDKSYSKLSPRTFLSTRLTVPGSPRMCISQLSSWLKFFPGLSKYTEMCFQSPQNLTFLMKKGHPLPYTPFHMRLCHVKKNLSIFSYQLLDFSPYTLKFLENPDKAC